MSHNVREINKFSFISNTYLPIYSSESAKRKHCFARKSPDSALLVQANISKLQIASALPMWCSGNDLYTGYVNKYMTWVVKVRMIPQLCESRADRIIGDLRGLIVIFLQKDVCDLFWFKWRTKVSSVIALILYYNTTGNLCLTIYVVGMNTIS